MRNVRLNTCWYVLLLWFFMSISGCDDGGTSNPLSPGQIKSVQAGTAISEEFMAYKNTGSFKVNIPTSGDYLLQYTTTRGSFELIFRLTEAALLTLELQEGDEIYEASLQKGAISSETTSQAIEIFDSEIFEADNSFSKIVLITQGAIPTPTPVPTATPKPNNPVASSTPTPLDPTAIPHSGDGDSKIIVAVGDSVTYGYGSGSGGYPAMLETKLRNAGYNVVVYNKGIPGEHSPDTQARFQSAISGADIVLLMIGLNDIVSPGSCANSDCQTSSRIAAMLDMALNSGVTPLVGTITPVHSQSSYDWANNEILTVNSQIKQVAGARGVIVVDTHQAITSHGGDSLFVDNKHFRDQGYDWISWAWHDWITGQNLLQ